MTVSSLSYLVLDCGSSIASQEIERTSATTARSRKGVLQMACPGKSTWECDGEETKGLNPILSADLSGCSCAQKLCSHLMVSRRDIFFFVFLFRPESFHDCVSCWSRDDTPSPFGSFVSRPCSLPVPLKPLQDGLRGRGLPGPLETEKYHATECSSFFFTGRCRGDPNEVNRFQKTCDSTQAAADSFLLPAAMCIFGNDDGKQLEGWDIEL